jgi:hypothetical protein
MGKYTPKLPKAVVEFEVRDKNGKLLEKGKLPAKSWVGNIIGLLSAILSTWSSPSSLLTVWTRSDLLDTDNTARNMGLGASASGVPHGGCASAGEISAGIVVGLSDTPVSIGQYKLITQIGHGTSGNQLQYGNTTVESLVKNSTWYFRIIRPFTNGSGGTVTVREIGLYVRLGLSGSPYYYSCMLARDVPASAINVPAGSTLTLRYIISHSLA